MAEDRSFRDTVLLITREGMGSADAALQQRLMETYLRLLLEHDSLPSALCFYTDGVKLVVDSSPVLGPLGELEKRGVRLIACSTCLSYFGLTDKVRVGIVGGMPDILEAQANARKVITV